MEVGLGVWGGCSGLRVGWWVCGSNDYFINCQSYIHLLHQKDITIGESKSAVVVDVDILVEEMGAGTGVDFRGGTFPLVVAEHPLPRARAAWACPC